MQEERKRILSCLMVLCIVLTVFPFATASVNVAKANISLSGVTYPSGNLTKGNLFVLKGTTYASQNIESRFKNQIRKPGRRNIQL